MSVSACNTESSSRKAAGPTAGTEWVPNRLFLRGRRTTCAVGLEERLHVYWNDYSDHPCDRLDRRLQRRWWRAILWHRVLRRWRPWAGHRHFADPAADGKTVSSGAMLRPR